MGPKIDTKTDPKLTLNNSKIDRKMTENISKITLKMTENGLKNLESG